MLEDWESSSSSRRRSKYTRTQHADMLKHLIISVCFPVEAIQMLGRRKTKLHKHAQRGSLIECKGANLPPQNGFPL